MINAPSSLSIPTSVSSLVQVELDVFHDWAIKLKFSSLLVIRALCLPRSVWLLYRALLRVARKS
eukprot:1158448-Pelagomonas_calceolata.AAC.8